MPKFSVARKLRLLKNKKHCYTKECNVYKSLHRNSQDTNMVENFSTVN